MTRTVAAALVCIACATGCANTKFNQLAPGTAAPAPRIIPDAIDIDVDGFVVHLDPTVMLWGRDATVDMRRLVRGAVSKIEDALNGSRAQISISAGSYRVIPDVGIGGSTDPRTGEVLVSMDSRSPVGLRKLLAVWLPLALAHELHHSKRILDGPGYGTTLLDTMIAEGGAEAFVREMYPHAPPIPWVQPLSKTRERRVWREAARQLDEPDDAEMYERWFLGKGDLPRWTGYRIGYAIALAHLAAHPAVSAAELARLPSERILDESGYAPGR